MGFYIETGTNKNKAQYLIDNHDGVEMPKPLTLNNVPESQALIVVIDSGPFEAAGYAYDEKEFIAFTQPHDMRPKRYVTIDRKLANQLTGRKEG